jgi:hypothetical protein
MTVRSASTVKFKDPTSGVSLDLNTNDLGGDANSRMILAYCRLAPFTLRPLIHTVKTWAKRRKLNDPAGVHGSPTLSSYCWTLMCIAYMQCIGMLPNLQDPESVRAAGREDCVVWVSWGRRRGQAAHIGFVEPSAEDYATFEASEDDIGLIVTGFFAFYYNMFRKDGKHELGPVVKRNGRLADTRHHVLSVWRGGLIERDIPVDPNAVSRRQIRRRKEEARMRAVGNVQPVQGNELVMSSLEQSEQASFVAGNENACLQEQPPFAQPRQWTESDLVVQDPFLHDKV